MAEKVMEKYLKEGLGGDESMASRASMTGQDLMLGFLSHQVSHGHNSLHRHMAGSRASMAGLMHREGLSKAFCNPRAKLLHHHLGTASPVGGGGGGGQPRNFFDTKAKLLHHHLGTKAPKASSGPKANLQQHLGGGVGRHSMMQNGYQIKAQSEMFKHMRPTKN